MYLSALLIVCLSQGEFGRIWALEQTDALYDLLPWSRGNSQEVKRTRRDQRQLGAGLAIDTLPDNKTHIVEDSHGYYSWRNFGPTEWHSKEQLWVDMESPQHGQVRMHGILSNTHRQAAQVPLSFDFPFYGHYLRQVTIATGGFIFTGEVTHRMLTATQYIAPLMANFDPSFSQSSTVQYMDDGEVFVVQWDRVRLAGREAQGEFTFQTALHRTGTIVFSYKDVPLPVEMMVSAQHPVKVGLSDAFMVIGPSPQNPDIQRKTIYEYHRAEIDTTMITNHSAFEFTPLPTCLQHDNCETCYSSTETTGCGWCYTLQRCSDGIDRHRQEWLDFGCSAQAEELTCEDLIPEETDGTQPPSDSNPTQSSKALPDCPVTEDDTKCLILHKDQDSKTGPPIQQGASVHSGIIAGVVTAVVLVLVLILLALYMNTHSYLIQPRTNYWPSMKYCKQGSRYKEMEGVEQRRGGLIEDQQY